MILCKLDALVHFADPLTQKLLPMAEQELSFPGLPGTVRGETPSPVSRFEVSIYDIARCGARDPGSRADAASPHLDRGGFLEVAGRPHAGGRASGLVPEPASSRPNRARCRSTEARATAGPSRSTKGDRISTRTAPTSRRHEARPIAAGPARRGSAQTQSAAEPARRSLICRGESTRRDTSGWEDATRADVPASACAAARAPR